MKLAMCLVSRSSEIDLLDLLVCRLTSRKLLERYQMRNCKPIETPVEKNVGLSLDMGPKTPEEREKMSRVPYSSAVRSLMYAMMCTRPDIS